MQDFCYICINSGDLWSCDWCTCVICKQHIPLPEGINIDSSIFICVACHLCIFASSEPAPFFVSVLNFLQLFYLSSPSPRVSTKGISTSHPPLGSLSRRGRSLFRDTTNWQLAHRLWPSCSFCSTSSSLPSILRAIRLGHPQIYLLVFFQQTPLYIKNLFLTWVLMSFVQNMPMRRRTLSNLLKG